jgi:hypothetical protein
MAHRRRAFSGDLNRSSYPSNPTPQQVDDVRVAVRRIDDDEARLGDAGLTPVGRGARTISGLRVLPATKTPRPKHRQERERQGNRETPTFALAPLNATDPLACCVVNR